MRMLDFNYTPPEPLVLDFDPPIEHGGNKLERLSLREPQANHVFAADQHQGTKNAARARGQYQRTLISKVGGVPEAALTNMPMSSFARAAAYLQGFVEGGLEEPASSDTEDDYGITLTITLDPPLEVNGATYPFITLNEPTLGQMTKAESALGDMTPQRIRMFQMSLVEIASGLSGVVVGALPITVLNRAATFLMGFSSAGRVTSN